MGSKTNPYPYMRMADVYIQPSYAESQCLSVYEALLLNKVIVTTNLPAFSEALQDGALGVICEPDAHAIAEKIVEICADTAVKNQIQNAVKNYSFSNAATNQKINDLFRV